ncbi:MAG: hypothetical protein ACK5OB_15545, partial [Pirellula sp.]
MRLELLLPIALAGLVLFGWCSSTLGQSAASLRADGAGPSASVIVVRPAGWETALAEWSRYRSSQY